MDQEEFKRLKQPREDFSPMLKALWYDAQGDWKRAHDQVDQLSSKSASRVHAYLHRKEGDNWNADYWYSKSGEKQPLITLDEEWEILLKKFFSEIQ